MDFVHNPYRCGPLRVGRYEVAAHTPPNKTVHNTPHVECVLQLIRRIKASQLFVDKRQDIDSPKTGEIINAN